MTASAGDIGERLSEIWATWGLSPDVALGEVQLRALRAVSDWLEQGKTDPEIAIRAVQILLADPERPGWNRRASWVALRKVLKEAWANAGTGPDHLFYAQALLLAAWPSGSQEGWLSLAQLMDSAWEVMKGRGRQSTELNTWRQGARRDWGPGTEREKPAAADGGLEQLADIRFSDSFDKWWAHLSENVGTQWYYNNFAKQLVGILGDHRSAFDQIASALKVLMSTVQRQRDDLGARVTESIEHSRCEVDLLWWGQARYCRARQKPYRRMSDPEDVLWCTAYEAAQLARSLDVEPAAAYLVETLHALDQNIFEKKSLLRWMEGLHAVLSTAANAVPTLSQGLQQIAKDDALGLPVTWARLRAAANEPLAGAADAVALDLDAEIDRGQWASWLFREILLDLRIADST